MPPLRVHHTDTVDKAWNGPANEARLRNDESEAYYRKAYAWQDPDGDAETKAAYKLIHHEVDGDGEIGAANVRGCIAAIGALNGARGGADIPDGDRQGCWSHLAAHLEDADVEPPALRAQIHGPERRSFPLREMRVVRENGARSIEGYAAVFEELSVPLWGGFREKIQHGAFAKTIREGDIRAVWNHSTLYVLGRSKNGTLELREDDVGLNIRIHPPDSQWARDCMVSIERGDVDQMSFSFDSIRDRWETVDGVNIRTLEEVKLWEVSPVTFPAYPQTSVSLRGLLGMESNAFIEALGRLEAGAMTPADRRLLEGAIQNVEKQLTAAPPEAGHPVDDDEPVQTRARLARMRRQIELIEKS